MAEEFERCPGEFTDWWEQRGKRYDANSWTVMERDAAREAWYAATASLRAEVERLTSERDAAVRKLEKLNRLHSGAWSCEDAKHTAKYYAAGIENILNGGEDGQ